MTTPLPALRSDTPTESARQLEAVLANIAEGVNIIDTDDRVVLVNEGFMRLYGFPPELATPGTPIAAFIRHRLGAAAAPDQQQDVEALVTARVQQLHDAGSGQVEEILPDGRVVEIRRQRLPDGLLVSTYSDVTEQKRHAERLALLATAVEQSDDAVELADAQFRLIFVNPAFTRLTGYTREEALGRAPSELLGSDQHGDAFFDELRTALTRGEVWQGQLTSRHKDGRLIYHDTTISPVRDREGRISHHVAVKRDVTERRRAEAELRESEERFRAIAEGVPLPIGISRTDISEMLFANQRALEDYALSAGADRTEILSVWANPEDRADLVRDALRDGRVEGREVQLRRADGTTFWGLVSARPMTYAGKPALLVVSADITERRDMERALRESEQRFRTIAEAHPVPMIIARLSDQVPLFVNAAFRELFELDQAEPNKADATQLYTRPSDRSDAFRLLVEQGRVDGHELIMRRAGGQEFPVSLSSRLIDYEGSSAAVTSFTDLTEKKRAEVEIARHREALHQTEKISALGTLLAGVAHELNNPLSVVVGQSTLLEETAPDEATNRRAAKIRGAADRCARIVRTFLTMARSRPTERGPVDINAMIEAALELLAYGLRTADVKVIQDLAPDLPSVWGEGDQLHQVLTNLIINAQHALQEIEPPRQLRISTQREGSMARVAVIDNGPGIEPEVAKRVFEPFFTTKPSGVGTGIGLSVCHGIIRGHEGSIELSSAPGDGASFVVTLPLAPKHRESSADATEGPDRSTRGHVLVVDDEPEVAELLAEILRQGGHEVSVAASGREALDLIGKVGVDLIVSDLRMPDLDGPALYRALANGAEELARSMIFVTGDALSHQAEQFLAESGAEVLEKPVDHQQLVARVDAKLAEGRTRLKQETTRSHGDGSKI